jgi:hypothetical protein
MAKRMHTAQFWLDEDEENDIVAFLVERAQRTASAPFSWNEFVQWIVREKIPEIRHYLCKLKSGTLVPTMITDDDDDMIDFFRLDPISQGIKQDGNKPEGRTEAGSPPQTDRQAGSDAS